ncbi:hypothetical protein LXL04_019653 [Taraxacum kok-saghyz]
MRILRAMVVNRQLDFAGLIFDHLVETINGKQRPPYVTFPRWIDLCLQHLGIGYVGAPEDEIKFATMSSRLINVAPQDGDPHLTNNMLAWSADPYFSNPRVVDFVPPIAAPVDQHLEVNPIHSDQQLSPLQPAPTASTSTSSSDAE